MDLCDKELMEAEVISMYLPKQLTDNELIIVLNNIIEKLGATGPQDMGKVMGVATRELSGKAEGKLIASKVKEILGSL